MLALESARKIFTYIIRKRVNRGFKGKEEKSRDCKGVNVSGYLEALREADVKCSQDWKEMLVDVETIERESEDHMWTESGWNNDRHWLLQECTELSHH